MNEDERKWTKMNEDERRTKWRVRRRIEERKWFVWVLMGFCFCLFSSFFRFVFLDFFLFLRDFLVFYQIFSFFFYEISSFFFYEISSFFSFFCLLVFSFPRIINVVIVLCLFCLLILRYIVLCTFPITGSKSTQSTQKSVLYKAQYCALYKVLFLTLTIDILMRSF